MVALINLRAKVAKEGCLMSAKMQKFIHWAENIVFFGLWWCGLLYFSLIFVGCLLPAQGKMFSFLFGDLLVELICAGVFYVYIYSHFNKSDMLRKLFYILGSIILFYLWLSYGLTNFLIVFIK